MNETIIFTDGSSRGNPGKGGWGAIVKQNDYVKELGGREELTTNNRMEMRAIIEALRSVRSQGKVIVHTDSSYVVKGIREWIHGWEKNNWMTKSKEPVLNSDIWKELKKATEGLSIFWKIIPGHAGIPGNERCDVIATSFADNAPIVLFDGNSDNYTVSLTIPDILPEKNKRKTQSGPAFSYVSKIDGVFYVDKTWKECEARVKGKKGALYKKVFSQAEEDAARTSW